MSIPIIINSEDGIASSTGSDFTVFFDTPIKLNTLGWKVGVVRLQTWFSTHNISSATSNNVFTYSVNSGGAWKTITIPDGNYSAQELNDFIQREMRDVGDYDAVNNQYYITLEPNFSTNRIKIFISNATYQIDLTANNNLAELLGFTEKVVTATETGSKEAEFSGGVNSWLLHCDLTSASYLNGKSSDTLLTFNPNVPSQASLDIEPRNITFAQVNKEIISSIRIRLTDENDNTLDLNGEETVVHLVLIPMNQG